MLGFFLIAFFDQIQQPPGFILVRVQLIGQQLAQRLWFLHSFEDFTLKVFIFVQWVWPFKFLRRDESDGLLFVAGDAFEGVRPTIYEPFVGIGVVSVFLELLLQLFSDLFGLLSVLFFSHSDNVLDRLVIQVFLHLEDFLSSRKGNFIQV